MSEALQQNTFPDYPALTSQQIAPGFNGLFAGQPYAEGQTVFALQITPQNTILTAAAQAGADDDFAPINRGIPYTATHYAYPLGPGHPLYFLNHGCNPNAAVADYGLVQNGRVEFVAIRPILPDEQVTIDYSGISEGSDPEYNIQCSCGASGCRGKIVCFALLPATEKERLVRSGLVLAHVIAEDSQMHALAMTLPNSSIYLQALSQQRQSEV